jgi:hypothetical protein
MTKGMVMSLSGETPAIVSCRSKIRPVPPAFFKSAPESSRKPLVATAVGTNVLPRMKTSGPVPLVIAV